MKEKPMYIDPKAIVGQTFSANDPNTEYVCVGYGQNETFLIIGSYFDSPNNRSSLKTFKLSDVKFKGNIGDEVVKT